MASTHLQLPPGSVPVAQGLLRSIVLALTVHPDTPEHVPEEGALLMVEGRKPLPRQLKRLVARRNVAVATRVLFELRVGQALTPNLRAKPVSIGPVLTAL